MDSSEKRSLARERRHAIYEARDQHGSNQIHVVPSLERHVTTGINCGCHPYRDRLDSRVIIHRVGYYA